MLLNSCTECGHKIRVVETVNGTDSIFRTRKCVPCDWLMVTEEKLTDDQEIPQKHRKAKDAKRYKASKT